jgi:predicted RNase H-like HicB family nuclease
MNKLTFRVAVEQARTYGYHAFVPGLMVCATGRSVEETLENTKSVILEYMPDSSAAIDALGMGGVSNFLGATWHTIEIIR